MASKPEILAALNVADLCKELIPSLKPLGTDGRQALGRCPFHDDKKPSLSVRLTDGAYNCKTCGKHGTWVVGLLQAVKGLGFPQAINELEARGGLLRSNIKAMPQKLSQTPPFEYYRADGTWAYSKDRRSRGADKYFVFWHLNENGVRVEKKPAGTPSLLYRLPEVLQAETVYFVEGEKHADFLHSWGLTGSTLDCGAQSKLTREQVAQLTGKLLVILPDNDAPGRQYAENIAAAMNGKAASVKVVVLPGLPDKGDVLDWQKKQGNDKAELLRLVESAPVWTAPGTGPEQAPPLSVALYQLSEADKLRVFPSCYLNHAKLLNDPRRGYFDFGQSAIFDAFIFRMAASPGGRYPNNPAGIARVMEVALNSVERIIDTALKYGMLELDTDGFLVNPVVSQWFIAALKTSAQNALNAKQPKKPRKTRPRKAL